MKELDKIISAVSLARHLKDIPEVFEMEELRNTMFSGWISTDPWYTKEFADTPRIRHEIVKKGNTTEIVEWQEPVAREDMVPDVIQLVEQGRDERKTPWLDSDYEVVIKTFGEGEDAYKRLIKRPINTMNDRIFRESCKVYQDQLYPVYEKKSVDFNTGTKSEWVAAEVGCEMIDAITMVEAWRKLNIDFTTARKLVRGYWDDQAQTWRNGLQKIGKISGRKYAKIFETIVRELDEISEENLIREHYFEVAQMMIETGCWRLRYHEDAPDAWTMMEFIENSAYVEMESEEGIFELESEVRFVDENGNPMENIMDPFGDEMGLLPSDDGFGVRPLYDGSEDISYELGWEISNATVDQISVIQKRFFRRFNQWTGRWNAPEYWWMPPGQKQKCWIRINDRKKELLEMAIAKLSKESKDVLSLAADLGNKRQARAMIAAYCAGNSFNLGGFQYRWDYCPDSEERYAIWGIFRRQEG